MQKKNPNSSIHVPLFWQGDEAQSSKDDCVTGFPVEELSVDFGVGSGTEAVFVVCCVETVGAVVLETVDVLVVLLLVSPGCLVVTDGVVFVVVVVVVVVDDAVVSANDCFQLDVRLVERHCGE